MTGFVRFKTVAIGLALLAGMTTASAQPAPRVQDKAERARLADEFARRESELAAIETEKQRLAEERRAVEQALAARLGAPAAPNRSTQPIALPGMPPRAPEPAPGAAPRGRSSGDCAELLMRAQLGELTPGGREQLRQCR